MRLGCRNLGILRHWGDKGIGCRKLMDIKGIGVTCDWGVGGWGILGALEVAWGWGVGIWGILGALEVAWGWAVECWV